MTSWQINRNNPSNSEKYSWRLPRPTSREHYIETQSPGDLLVKPSNLDITPGEVQVPAERNWVIEISVTDEWYVQGGCSD